MIFLIGFIFFALFGIALDAQTLPALYNVTGVEADDLLNVRNTPYASSDITATIDPSGTNIEIVAMNGERSWGLVNIGEQSGWASLRFLERQPNQGAGEFPAITACYGTEPFWDIDFAESKASFSLMGETSLDLIGLQTSRSANRIDRFSITSQPLVGVIQRQLCSDGMSDRSFGLSIEVLTKSTGEVQHLSGCCTIQPKS